MAKRTRKYYTSKRNRRILVSAVAIFIVLIAVLAYVDTLRPSVAKKDSSKYFTFSELGAQGKQMGLTNITIRILTLWFNFTPVGGDAHFVVIFTEGMTDATQYTWDEISNGTSTYSGEIQSSRGIVASKADDGYAVKVRINCKEADGWTTLIIPDNLVFLTP